MLLYHGSSQNGLQTLRPFLADHGKPYVYFSTDSTAAAFYTACAVERPYYFFPYGYDAAARPVYTETYPGALRETYAQKSGYLYVCDLPEAELLRFPSNPHMRLTANETPVLRVEAIENLYEWFLKKEAEGKLTIQRYESLAKGDLASWHGMVLEELRAACAETHDNAYAAFVRRTMPQVWERFVGEPDYECAYSGPLNG